MNLRQKRLAREVKQHIIRLLHAEIRDPRLADVHITAVIMSPDLGWAKVYWTLGQPGDVPVAAQQDSDAAVVSGNVRAAAGVISVAERRLGKTEGFFKMHLARALRLRRVPRLRFYYDHSLARGQKIQELLTTVLP